MNNYFKLTQGILATIIIVSLGACSTTSQEVKNNQNTSIVSNELGSKNNPIKVYMPMGEHNYLRRLRCKNGVAPDYYRIGNVGVGVFGNIVDLYSVTCVGSEPAKSNIYMDMYFPKHIEKNAPNGFILITE